MFNSLQPHELQYAMLPCPSPSPGTCSNSYPSNQWCRPTTSSSVFPFSSCFQSFPASESYNFENKFNFSQKKALRSTNFMVTCTLKKGSQRQQPLLGKVPRQNRIKVSGLPPSKVLSLNQPIVVKCPLTFQQHSDVSFYNTNTKIHSNFPFLNFSPFWPFLGWNVTSSELSLTLCAIFQPCHFPSRTPCLTIIGTQYIPVELFKIFIPTHTKQGDPGCRSSSSMDD